MSIRNKFLVCICLVLSCGKCFAQKMMNKSVYRERADKMFVKVWNHYRVEKFPGLFSEHYPAGKKNELTYFQGHNVQEKEVSFLWPFSSIFSAANVLVKNPEFNKKYLSYLDTLAEGIWQYRDTTRIPFGYQAYPSKLEKADRYYDDNGLVGIDYAEAYLNTKNPVYLKKAKEVFEFIISGWDDQLGGGVYWLEGHKDQKPACSNGMATLAALKIYQCSKDPYYLDWGKKFYNWMHNHLRNSEGVYYNDIKMDSKPNKVYYTYNTGSMLESAVLLYQFTKEESYLKEAQAVALGSFNHFSELNKLGVRTFKIDLPWFLTVLFRGYEALYNVDGNPKYIKAVTAQLDLAWDESKDHYGFLTADWSNKDKAKRKPKWLLDQGCIAELYGRISALDIK